MIKRRVCGLLVEDYLMGKFTKYNGNNGYVIKRKRVGAGPRDRRGVS